MWVDDAPENNRHEQEMLTALGIETLNAKSTDEAMGLLSGFPPQDDPQDVLADRDGGRAAEADRQFQIQQDVGEPTRLNAFLGFILGPDRLAVIPEGLQAVGNGCTDGRIVLDG
jgi:hypothetical protein